MRYRIRFRLWLLPVLVVFLVTHVGCSRTPTASVAEIENAGAEMVRPVVNSDIPSPLSTPPSAPLAGYQFASPTRIKAGDVFISVESPGYACPTVADVDGDGKVDLVVGQFRNGHMQFCRNIGATGKEPKFAAAEWLKTGDQRAEVPGVW